MTNSLTVFSITHNYISPSENGFSTLPFFLGAPIWHSRFLPLLGWQGEASRPHASGALHLVISASALAEPQAQAGPLPGLYLREEAKQYLLGYVRLVHTVGKARLGFPSRKKRFQVLCIRPPTASLLFRCIEKGSSPPQRRQVLALTQYLSTST